MMFPQNTPIANEQTKRMLNDKRAKNPLVFPGMMFPQNTPIANEQTKSMLNDKPAENPLESFNPMELFLKQQTNQYSHATGIGSGAQFVSLR